MGKKKRNLLYLKYDGLCAYCGKQLELHNTKSKNYLQIDHIIPNKSDKILNLNPSCKTCNTIKKNNSLEIFRFKLFNHLNKNPSFDFKQKKYLKNKYNIDIDEDLKKENFKFYFEIHKTGVFYDTKN